ncbi:MAG: prepilin-type N-terminal cleavage/methylation domain-containing protein [Deltaproteobacteria bacterium]|nr:prepilin-type N-terminal cleavage/methylation domain-containing protein [Deltaproteobacteria bacterium]
MLMRLNDIARGNRGFQLVELLVVIALISILVAIGVPTIVDQIRHLRLSRSVRDLATELNAARLKAIAQNTKYRVSVTLPNTYLLQKWDTTTSSWVNDPSHGIKTIEPGINISNPAVNFIPVFYPNGTATVVDIPNGICMDNPSWTNDKMKITVQGPTGMITITTGC